VRHQNKAKEAAAKEVVNVAKPATEEVREEVDTGNTTAKQAQKGDGGGDAGKARTLGAQKRKAAQQKQDEVDEAKLKKPDIHQWALQRAAKIEEMKKQQRQNPKHWRSREDLEDADSSSEEGGVEEVDTSKPAAEEAQKQDGAEDAGNTQAPAKTPGKAKACSSKATKDSPLQPQTGLKKKGNTEKKLPKIIPDAEAATLVEAVQIKLAAPERELSISTKGAITLLSHNIFAHVAQ
jgi:hypothetical protein